MGNISSTSSINSNWAIAFDDIKNKHDAAYKVIEKGITQEEQNKPQEAIQSYKEGIFLIDEALRIPVTCPANPDITWERACLMIQKMKKTRAEVLSRINNLQSVASESFEIVEPPPSYEEATSEPTTPQPQTYSELAQALQQLSIDPNQQQQQQIEPEVVYICDGVKLYFISPNGEVSSPLHPQTLKITIVENDGGNVPRAVLQIGSWVYPLIPGVSPCYRSEYGAFILPNVYATIPNSSVGIILPQDADADTYEILENILYGIVGKGEPPTKPAEEDLSQKISTGIVTGNRFNRLSTRTNKMSILGAGYLSQGLIKGAEKLGGLINQSTPKLIDRIQGAERPTTIPPPVTKSMKIAENATNTAVKVTGFVVDQVGAATVKLGHFLAPHIQKQGTRLLTTGFRMSEQEASRKVRGVMTVAAGAVEGFSTVYHGLENSAAILATSLKNNTVKVVEHKYGQPAGQFTDETLNTVGNVYRISNNARIIRPKNLVKKTVKEAGKAVVYEYRNINDGASTSGNNLIDDQEESEIHDNKISEKKQI